MFRLQFAIATAIIGAAIAVPTSANAQLDTSNQPPPVFLDMPVETPEEAQEGDVVNFTSGDILTTFTFSLDPKSTFRLTNEDPFATNPLILDLSTLNVASGDEIFLQALGNFSFHGNDIVDIAGGITGIFSSSNELLSSDNLNRVPGAIDLASSDLDVVTFDTYRGGVSTDISEDFAISTAALQSVIVPDMARYLFLATANDSFYGDNVDPDENYGVRIVTPSRDVPEPSILLGTAIATALGWCYSRKLS